MTIDYKQAGVDVEAGDALVDWLQSSGSRMPHADKMISGIGGFASLFRLDFPHMKKPCLITCTDGVGTKVKIAAHYGRYEGVGQDLVAMCVNDLICCGGEPLLFLDYYAVGKLDLKAAKSFLESVRAACLESDCNLAGGETAEMPGVYQVGDFDCAGFAVGVVDEEQALSPKKVQVGDVLIGVSSSGFHSNGYSLLRKLFADDMDAWSDELLKPTALYVRLMKSLMKEKLLHGAAHITGGGIENIPRALPAGTLARIQMWELPKAFQEVRQRAQLSEEALVKTLNGGIGFVLVAAPSSSSRIHELIKAAGFLSFDLGKVEKSSASEPSVVLEGGCP